MTSIRQLASTVASRIHRWRFFRYLPAIRSTPVLRPGGEPFVLLSMVHHRDVESYLLAAKSFARFLKPRRAVVVTDPSITEADRVLIAEQIDGVEFIMAESRRDGVLPTGGCWERLAAISDLVGCDYVVQLDADTVTLDDLPEVRDAIRSGCSFALGTKDGQEITTSAAASALARSWVKDAGHVQVAAESQLDRMPNAEAIRYVRGCAGFSGFAPGSFDRASLHRLNAFMAEAIGDTWNNWGSEQFASNFMVANSPAARLLPHPKYCEPSREKPGTVFLHFIGYVRFASDRYLRAARQVCEALAVDKRLS